MTTKLIRQWRNWIVNTLLVIFGMTMMVTPLTLWVAPTKDWFFFVLIAFVVSGVSYWQLAGIDTSSDEEKTQLKK